MTIRAVAVVSLLALAPLAARAADVPVNADWELRVALAKAKPGAHLRLGPGPFTGGFFAVGLAGTKERPIRISGSSADKPAVFRCDKAGAIQLVGASYVEIANLHVTTARGNALAFDDGGKEPFSCHHITVRDCRVDDVGPDGACAIKMAGVADFAIVNCTFKDASCGSTRFTSRRGGRSASCRRTRGRTSRRAAMCGSRTT